MTWEEIEPIAALFLGENCGKLTLDELYANAHKYGIKKASEFVKLIEDSALAYEWLSKEGGGREEDYRNALSIYATHLEKSNALEQLNCVE